MIDLENWLEDAARDWLGRRRSLEARLRELLSNSGLDPEAEADLSRFLDARLRELRSAPENKRPDHVKRCLRELAEFLGKTTAILSEDK